MSAMPIRNGILALGLLVAAASAGAASAEEQDVVLRPGDGQDVVMQNCAGCHSVDYIPMNGFFLKEEGWKAEVGKMRKAFGAPINDADAETIVRYLAEQYSAAATP